jgi:hypothetical protein
MMFVIRYLILEVQISILKLNFEFVKIILFLCSLQVRLVMSPKIEKISKTQKSRELEVSKEAMKILRTVRDGEAFYFYENIGKPTGESAKSLSDFLERIKSVKLESLLFHLQRKDFQNWIIKTLGDSKLSKEIGKIPPSNSENIRTKMHLAVERRIKELNKGSITLLVNENLAVASSSPTL